MAVTVACTSVHIAPAPGTRILINWDDGTQNEFPDADAMKASIAGIDTDPAEARSWLIARWVRQDPDQSNPNQIAGHSITLDAGAGNPITIR